MHTKQKLISVSLGGIAIAMLIAAPLSLALAKDNDHSRSHSQDSQEQEGDGAHCPGFVPPGHLIAPGWLKHHDGIVPTVPSCETVPHGIDEAENEHDDHQGEPGDVITISAVAASAGTSTAMISWNTNTSSTSEVSYGLSPAYGLSTGITTALVTSHSVMLTGLAPSSTYHFQVASMDNDGDVVATSSDMTFTTGAVTPPDVTPPILSAIASTPATSTATITWTSNESSTSQVFFGLTSAYGSSTAQDSTLITSHSQMLTGLTPGTTYHFQVQSKDGSSNAATSSDQTFATAALPVIASTTVTSASTTATIAWDTNVSTTGMVFYSTTSPVNPLSSSTFSVGTTTLSMSHSIQLTGLSASTTYFFVLQSIDTFGDMATGSQASFTTTP